MLGSAADVCYVLQEQPHPIFRRQGSTLQFTATISLAKALTGTIIDVPTLDGRILPVAITDVVK